MYFYGEYSSIFNVTQKLVFTLLLFRTTRITAYDVIKSVIERSVEEAERRGTSAGESTLKSWNPVFTWSASPSFPLAIRPESYVSHRVLQSLASRAHARWSRRQREKPARQVSKGATRSSAPESETFVGSPCARLPLLSVQPSRALKTVFNFNVCERKSLDRMLLPYRIA